MTTKEAEMVLSIMTHADGGCHVCASSLMLAFVVAFGFRKEAIEIYKEHFGLDLNEESREGMQVCTCEPVWDCQGKTFAINPNCKIHGSGDGQPQLIEGR